MQIAEWLKELKFKREGIEKVFQLVKEIHDIESTNHDNFDDYSKDRYDVACEVLNIINKYRGDKNNGS